MTVCVCAFMVAAWIKREPVSVFLKCVCVRLCTSICGMCVCQRHDKTKGESGLEPSVQIKDELERERERGAEQKLDHLL